MARAVTSNVLLGLLDEARAAASGAVHLASDGDHTIWRCDVGFTLFERAVARRLLRVEARARLAREARDNGIVATGDANDIAVALWAAHGHGRYPSRDAFAMHAWCFAGHRDDELRGLCGEVLDQLGFEGCVRPELARIRAWADEHDIPLWVVSASPQIMVEEAAARLGWPVETVVAMEAARADDVILPDIVGEPTYAEGKLARLHARADGMLLAAFGDSLYDFPMIAAAQVGVAVAPTPELAARMASFESGLVLQED